MKVSTMLYSIEINTIGWSDIDYEIWEDMTAREKNYFISDLIDSEMDVVHHTPTIFRQIQSVE